MTANTSDRPSLQFRVLSDAQCQEIYLATLECLNRIGIEVNHAEARAVLVAAGARAEGNLVRIPAQIIQGALAVTPHTFDVWGRDGQHVMHVGSGRVHFGPGLTNPFFIDPETGERRTTRRGDPATTARVADALENIDYVMGLGLIGNVQSDLASVYEFAELIANTGKPIIAWAHSHENVEAMYRMAVAVTGSEAAFRERPIFALFSTYPSPLRHSNEDLANILWAAAHDIPVVYLGGPTVGLESPVTGAGALVIHLAAALSALAVVQLKHRGAPMAIGGVPSAMDLRTARPAYGSPETSLYTAAAVDVARYLGVPFMGTAGASESKLLDSQAAIESSVQVLMSALSGVALVHDVGFLDCANIGSLPLLVMNDEIIGLVRRIMRGVEVSADTIMLDLIEKVGPGGNFLTERRSSSLSRKEIWVPKLMDRNPHTAWENEGRKSMEARVLERLRKILSTHQPPALPEGTTKKIEAILAQAERRL